MRELLLLSKQWVNQQVSSFQKLKFHQHQNNSILQKIQKNKYVTNISHHINIFSFHQCTYCSFLMQQIFWKIYHVGIYLYIFCLVKVEEYRCSWNYQQGDLEVYSITMEILVGLFIRNTITKFKLKRYYNWGPTTYIYL